MNLENKIKKVFLGGALAIIATTAYADFSTQTTVQSNTNTYIITETKQEIHNDDKKFIDSIYAPFVIFGGAYLAITIAGMTYEKIKDL